MIDGRKSAMVTILNVTDKFLKLSAGNCCSTGVEVDELLNEVIPSTAKESSSKASSISPKGCINCVQDTMVLWAGLDMELAPFVRGTPVLSGVSTSVEQGASFHRN